MTDFPDHYAALGIRPTADQEVIAAAYRALVKKYHPDTAQGDGETAAARFREVKDAHDVLGHPERRRAYDAQRAARGLDRSGEEGAETALAGDARRTIGRGSAALPGGSVYSTRPAETVFRAEREEELPEDERSGLFRFAVMAVLSCFIAAGVLLVLWPSISGSLGFGDEGVQALQPPPAPASEPPPKQNVTETAKSDPADGGDALKAKLPQGGAEAPAPAKPKTAAPKPAEPKPAAETPKPAVIEEEVASLYALTMREQANGVTTVLADGTLTFNTRKACEDFAREARDRRLDAAIMQTGESPEISWECRGR